MCLILLVQLTHTGETPLPTYTTITPTHTFPHSTQTYSTENLPGWKCHKPSSSFLESSPPLPLSLSSPSSKRFVMQQNLLWGWFNLRNPRTFAVLINIKVKSGLFVNCSHLVYIFKTSGVKNLRKKEKRPLTSVKCLLCSRYFCMCQLIYFLYQYFLWDFFLNCGKIHIT